MGKRTNRFGFSWRRGSSASSGLSVGATVTAFSVLTSATMGLMSMFNGIGELASIGAFSLPALKSSFLTGDSILKSRMADAAYDRYVLVSC